MRENLHLRMLYEWLNAELSLFCTELDELRIRLNLNPIRIRKID